MGSIAIKAEGIGKRYYISQVQRYKSLRDTLMENFKSSLHLFRGKSKYKNKEV